MRWALALMWLVHKLPFTMLSRLGQGLGQLAYYLAAPRRRVAAINVALCFPELDKAQQRAFVRAHFRAFGSALLAHSVLWFGSEPRVRELVRFVGLQHWHAVGDQAVILFAPHFVGLDMGGIRFSIENRVVSMYTKQKNRQLDAVIRRGRERLGGPLLFSRQDGVRPVIKAIKEGWPFYYLPDMDFGPRESIFVPFFGVQAATVPALSRLAQVTRAVVLPCVTKQLTDGCYETRFYPVWENFPSGDIEKDTSRMNTFIEERVKEMPEQYLWTHKRFKTRPPGEARYY